MPPSYDHCVRREVIAKQGLCAMLAVCILLGRVKVATVNVYSRFGSDMTLVLFVREVLLQSIGTLVVAEQMNFDHDEVIATEHIRKNELEVNLGQLKEELNEVTNQIEDAELRSEQIIMGRIANISPTRVDLQELIEVSETKPSQRIMFPQDVMILLKPKPRDPSKQRRNVPSDRARPITGRRRQRVENSRIPAPKAPKAGGKRQKKGLSVHDSNANASRGRIEDNILKGSTKKNSAFLTDLTFCCPVKLVYHLTDYGIDWVQKCSDGDIESIEINETEETNDRTLVMYRAVNILCPTEKVDRVKDLVNRVVPSGCWKLHDGRFSYIK
jgi:hypothetical protein